MKILGIAAFYHDSAAALLCDGDVVAAAQEERFTRKKHDPSFPTNAIRYCLTEAGRTVDELDAIVFYDKPFLKFERLLETYYDHAPFGLRSFVAAMPIWIKEKIFLKKLLRDSLKALDSAAKKRPNLLFSEHHLSHAASAYFPSRFDDAAILTIDGVGEWATASIAHGMGNSITVHKELHFPHSVGLLYSAFTHYCGFKVNSGEYKLMGLAPYGNHGCERVNRFKELITSHLVTISDDGSIRLNLDYFDYPVGLTMTNTRQWRHLFGVSPRSPEGELTQEYCDLALAIQSVIEDIVLKLACEAKRITGSSYLCMAGGVALNCVANGKLLREGIFEDIYIQPAAGDAGGALGAALAAHHISFNEPKVACDWYDAMHGAYLGPEFSDHDIIVCGRKYSAPNTEYSDFLALAARVAQLIGDGAVVGWFQGRMEWGPRALCNRSILGDARNKEMQKKLNLKIKYREGFRPFAPVVLQEDASMYFDLDRPSPYMLLVADIIRERQNPLPDNYSEFGFMDKLYFVRSDIPAVTHLDYSARVQTIDRSTNERMWILLNEFKKLTGYSVMVNTSFNVRGEPIVCTPDDAYRCFMRTEMDYLVMGNRLFAKTDQPSWQEKGGWEKEFALD